MLLLHPGGTKEAGVGWPVGWAGNRHRHRSEERRVGAFIVDHSRETQIAGSL